MRLRRVMILRREGMLEEEDILAFIWDVIEKFETVMKRIFKK